ncbi:hypothetical protein [Salinarimonas soli]|uniref:SH3 domain-containing protein n=1 Tax=Salinarimonas soli TaxID=1638099 RepID=A0A5B2VE43_9HYPH|nr:hypothetical protein [Salinarimonas soli]KAA2237361.1 hypothetical protein F0L46_10200 [Salinarimonas soli]
MRPLILALALLASPARAQAPVDCLVEAYGHGTGVAVREAPSPEAAVLLRLPDPVLVGDGEVAVAFTVTGWVPGWFRIEEAGYSDEVGFVPGGRRVPLERAGWVAQDAVRTTAAGLELRAEPREGAPVSARVMGLQRMPGSVFVLHGPEGVGVRALRACRGAWVELDTDMGRGWTDAVCARQRTACE